MGEPLARPPVVEALVEFRFAAAGWDWTLPGRLYEKVRDEFPERVELRPPVFVLGQPATPGSMEVPPAGPPERLQFKRRDGTAMVQVGPGVLVINHLRPYPKWLKFRELVLKIYEKYNQINEGAVPQRIGVRYINHFATGELALPSDMPVVANIEKCLDMKPKSLFQKFDLEVQKPPALLVHQCGTIDVQGAPIFVLDLDFISTGVTSWRTSEEIGSWLDAAHDVIERAFVNSMSPQLYERLRRGGER